MAQTVTIKIDADASEAIRIIDDLQTRLDDLQLPEIEILEGETIELESRGWFWPVFFGAVAGTAFGRILLDLFDTARTALFG